MISGKLTLIALVVTGFASSIGSAQVIRDHRRGYVWIPGSESVPGHWERAKAQPESQPETVPGDTSSSGRSLRGGSAEFFVEPMLRGGRLMACSRNVWDTQCISETADSFCREKGWDVSAFDVTESIGKRLYFAEVLCIRRKR